jgi:ribonuclease HIII
MTLVFTGIFAHQLGGLAQMGFDFVPAKSSFEKVRYTKPGIAFILYTSGRLVIQHKQEDEDEVKDVVTQLGIASKLAPQKKKSTQMTLGGQSVQYKEQPTEEYNLQIHIGSDEALKGDTFGGLVVCSFYYNPKDREDLINLGVKDSKLLTDAQIRRIAASLGGYKHYVENVFPVEYNAITSKVNVTALLNELHSSTAAQLGDALHITDKYPGCTVGEPVEKAESKSLAVAAASIIARAKGLEQFEELSARAGFKLPLGSTHVKEALERMKAEGKDFNEFAKVSFRNVKEFL